MTTEDLRQQETPHESPSPSRAMWDGFTRIGRSEIDLAKYLDRRVSITVLELDRSKTGPLEFFLR
jgi:hypothetical protein